MHVGFSHSPDCGITGLREGLGVWIFWKHKREGAAFVQRAFHKDRSAVQLNQFAAEIEPKPHSLLGGGITGFDLVQPVENVLLLLEWDATAGIGDGYLKTVRMRFSFHHANQ